MSRAAFLEVQQQQCTTGLVQYWYQCMLVWTMSMLQDRSHPERGYENLCIGAELQYDGNRAG